MNFNNILERFNDISGIDSYLSAEDHMFDMRKLKKLWSHLDYFWT